MNINSLEEESRLSKEDIQKRLETTRKILRDAGAHYVIDSVADIESVLEDINLRLKRNERP